MGKHRRAPRREVLHVPGNRSAREQAGVRAMGSAGWFGGATKRGSSPRCMPRSTPASTSSTRLGPTADPRRFSAGDWHSGPVLRRSSPRRSNRPAATTFHGQYPSRPTLPSRPGTSARARKRRCAHSASITPTSSSSTCGGRRGTTRGHWMEELQALKADGLTA